VKSRTPSTKTSPLSVHTATSWTAKLQPASQHGNGSIICFVANSTRDADRFRSLRENSSFISKRGRRTFDHTPSDMIKSIQVDQAFYAESNLSANGICDVVRRLLAAFEISKEQLQLLLR
jgi:hypothetical protein